MKVIPLNQLDPAIWQRHAIWMLAVYSRTGDFKHLLAFARHVHGMRQRGLAINAIRQLPQWAADIIASDQAESDW